MLKSYNDLKGLQYARDIVEGKIISSKYIRLECQKYIDRIDKYQHDDDFEYYFDLKEASDIYGMLSLINFGSGKFAGKPFLNHLAPFQFMVIENLFCWFHKDLGRNKRMIEEVILFISRKNAKSTLSALIEIIIMLRSPKMSQHAIAGKTKGISELILKDIARIIASSPKIQHLFKVNKNEIVCKHNNSFCRNLSGDASSLDGLINSSLV